MNHWAVNYRAVNDGTVGVNYRARVDWTAHGWFDDGVRRRLALAVSAAGGRLLGQGRGGQCERNERYESGHP